MPTTSLNRVRHEFNWQTPGRGKFPGEWNYVTSLFQKLLRFARKHWLLGVLFNLFSSLRRRLPRAVARDGPRRDEIPPKQHRSAGPFPLLECTARTQLVSASRVPTSNVVSGDGLPLPTDAPYWDNPHTGSLHSSAQDGESAPARADQHNGFPDDETGRGLLDNPHEALHPGGISAFEGSLHDPPDLGPGFKDEDASGGLPQTPSVDLPVPNSGSPPEHPDYSVSARGFNYGLPGTPYVLDPLTHRGSQTLVSPKSERSNRSAKSVRSLASVGRASYRPHTGPEPRTRSHSIRSSRSAAHSTAAPGPHRALETEATSVPTGTQLTSYTTHAIPVEPCSTVEDEHPRFAQITSADVRRYQRNDFKSDAVSDHKIGAMQYKYPLYGGDLPDGWKAHRHPEGALFYLLDRTEHQGQPTFTEVNVIDVDIRRDVEYFSTILWGELSHEKEERQLQDLKLEEVQLVVEPRSDENGVLCCYYFVDCANRSLFWLDEWDAHDVFSPCKGVDTLSHKGLAVEAHYW